MTWLAVLLIAIWLIIKGLTVVSPVLTLIFGVAAAVLVVLDRANVRLP